MIDTKNFVRVTQYTNAEIVGRYDGNDFVFPDSHDGAYLDVEKIVALHVFGFMGTDDQKTAAVLRLGWVNRMPVEEARKQLDQCVAFHDVPPFPAAIAEFRRSRDPAQRVPYTTEQEGQRAEPSTSEAPPGDFNPFEKQPRGRRGA